MLGPSGVGRRKMSLRLKAIPLLLLGRWGRPKALAMIAGSALAIRASTNPDVVDLVSLIVKHFHRRKARVSIFSDQALKRLSTPVMLIVGGRDPLLDSDESKGRLERLAPHLTVRFLPQAGHLLPRQTIPVLDFLCGAQAAADGSSADSLTPQVGRAGRRARGTETA